MSFPLNVSFKDEEFAKLSPAAAKSKKTIRQFVKESALRCADEVNNNKGVQ